MTRVQVRRRLRSALLLGGLAFLVAVLVAGCAAGPQREPVAIDVSIPGTVASRPPAPEGPRTVTVHLVGGDRLVRVERSAPDAGLDSALEQLLSGPTSDERRAGARTAVAPASLQLVGADATTGMVVIEVTDDFTATAGTDQLLAVAQVVWTVTEVPGLREVSLTKDGDPLEVPTDDGLTRVPVSRQDFEEVGPVAAVPTAD